MKKDFPAKMLVVERTNILVWFGLTNGADNEANQNTNHGGGGTRLS